MKIIKHFLKQNRLAALDAILLAFLLLGLAALGVAFNLN